MRRTTLTESVRRRLERLPPPFDAHYGVVPSAPVEEPVDISAAVGAHNIAMKAIQKADRISGSLPNHFLLSRILVRQEAINSSSIEGTHSTLDAVLEAEEAGEEGNVDAETGLVRDYAVALEHTLALIERDRRQGFTLELIQDLHRNLMTGDPDYKDTPGELRTRVVWIGGKGIEHSAFNPPSPMRMRQCVDEHIAYLRTDGLQQVQQSIIVRLAIAHAHFEAVHPFRDGNGRLGRLLIPLMMAADEHAPLYLSPYINANKPRYLDGLKAAQQRLDYAPLVNLLSDAIIASVREAEQSVEALRQLKTVWLKRRKFRKNSAAERAVELLTGFPVMTARRLSRELNITYAAANTGISQLAGTGILKEHTSHRRNRLFVARDVLRIFNRPFGDEPEIPKI
ncbi:MAG: Fic family protein [Rhodomicrobium sp.]